MTFAFESEDGAMVYEPINNRRSGHRVREHLCPSFEVEIGRQGDTAPLVSL